MAPEGRTPDPGKPHERRLTAEYVAARALLEATTIDEAAPKILEAICEALGWEHGALWTIDRDSDVLRCARDLDCARGRFPSSTPSAARIDLRAAASACPAASGRAASRRGFPTSSSDANFPRAPIAAREGLHARVRLPGPAARRSPQRHGVLQPRDPRADDDLLSMLTTVGNQIGMFIERRRAQEELDRFFTLSLDMLCVAGFDGYFKRVNPAWQRVLGYTEDELLSRPYMDFVHPDDREATIAEAAKSRPKAHELVYFENRYFHKDGTLRWLLWAADAVSPEQQVVYAAAHDITERKAAEETLARYARDLEPRIARSRIRPRASRSSSRSSRSRSGAPKRRRKPRARSSPT